MRHRENCCGEGTVKFAVGSAEIEVCAQPGTISKKN
jgi:hypothetical protein